MERFKQTWLAVGQWCCWVLGVCVDARCQREALRRQRFAQRGIGADSSTYFLESIRQ
jgi:hypothetical protein